MASQGPQVALLVSIGLLGLWFLRALLIRLRQAGPAEGAPGFRPPGTSVTGFVTTFFDTLGIGNFATTTTIFRTWHLVPDELIPGTLNVGHSIAAVLGAFIFIGLVPVTSETLLPTIVASGLGAWLGSGWSLVCLATESAWAWEPPCSRRPPSCFSRSSNGSRAGEKRSASRAGGGPWPCSVTLCSAAS